MNIGSCCAVLTVVSLAIAGCTGELSYPGAAGSQANPASGNNGGGIGSDNDGNGNNDGNVESGSGGTATGSVDLGDGGGEANSSGGSSSEPALTSRVGLAARLSKNEYRNSVFDVLGVSLLAEELDADQGGIPDDTGDGVFKHLADNQTSVEQHALAYFQVAEAVAQRVNMPSLLEQIGACTEATDACGATTIEALGRRLFRRPLDQREVEAMLVVYRAGLEESLDHNDAARWTLMALLSSPQFLFKIKDEVSGTPGQPRDLDSFELGAQLAAFLWVSVPDEALLEAAANQSLLQPEGLEAQVTRMLADPKAQRFTEVFATDFSRARFSSYEGATDADRTALNESVVATFQDHFWNQQGGIADLFTTTRFVVNQTVANLLEIEMAGEGLEVVDASSMPQRFGLLSHPGMIAGMGDRLVGSFVNRGKYLMERLLCRHPTAFPADITSEIEAFNNETTGLNEHERAEIRMTRNECWNCHRQFEPLAFGFSRFDGAGRYVGATDMDGKPLPLDGWVPTGEADEPTYDDIESYMQVLATNPVVQSCMTEHFIDFATSRIGDALGREEAKRVGEEYLANGSTLSAMVAAVVKSPLFSTVLPAPSGTQP